LKTLVLGLGNPILTDDGMGIYVVREMATHCKWNDVTFGEGCTSVVTAAIPRAVEAVLAELETGEQ
jgi:Ni,Fe-hydrogenase maturation factor